jgi:hypothetical protein
MKKVKEIKNECYYFHIDLVLAKLVQGTRYAISEKKKVLRTYPYVTEMGNEIESLQLAVVEAEKIILSMRQKEEN